MIQLKQIAAGLILSGLVAISYAPAVLATDAKSTNYGVSEVHFGSGGALHACSTTYCAKQSAGELTAGNAKSPTYQTQAGSNTNREPYLNVNVTSNFIDLGLLTELVTGSGTAAFNVSTYLASGYNVYISGTTPVNKSTGHVLTPLASPATSQIGIEQFGINLKQNTVPAVGSNEVQVPSSTFAFGAAATGYNTANTYKYINGDIIAQSTQSTSETDYTMSAIANVATTTAAGVYNGRLIINVVPSF